MLYGHRDHRTQGGALRRWRQAASCSHVCALSSLIQHENLDELESNFSKEEIDKVVKKTYQMTNLLIQMVLTMSLLRNVGFYCK